MAFDQGTLRDIKPVRFAKTLRLLADMEDKNEIRVVEFSQTNTSTKGTSIAERTANILLVVHSKNASDRILSSCKSHPK